MARNFFRKKSKLAYIGRWVGLFCANLLLVTIILHRFFDLSTPATVNLIAVAFIGGGLAFLLSGFSLFRIWNTGDRGGAQAVAGIIVGALMFSVPVWYLPKLMALPQINDVSTDLKTPPRFNKVTQIRPAGTNSTIYPGTVFADNQTRAYPDIVPFTLERSYDVAFEIVKEAAVRLGWEVVSLRPPKKAGRYGYLEAVDKTLVFGFKDDIAVRVIGNNKNARIDVRSASRYGRHDLGRNAARIRNLFDAIKTDLDQFERSFAERKAAEDKIKAKKLEEARKKRLAQERLRKARRARARTKKRRVRKRKKKRRRKKQWSPFY